MSAPNARSKILDAAIDVIRARGFAASSVDDLCRAAGVTKGAFFHHFAGKDALGEALVDHWSAVTAPLFAAAPYHQEPDPLDRVLGYVAFRRALLDRPVPDFTCVAGTMVQETFDSHPAIAAAAQRSIVGHARTLVADIQAAMDERGGPWPFTALSLAIHTQTVLQGAFVLAKAMGGHAVAEEACDHLARYIRLCFESGPER